ncbi:unnamed protein product [Fusarium graminearum]|uniref:Uncharacterized protein n=1 Tax=Gibberella zeae TaxID=5518 RepID=A0A4E9DSX9_GIBZA|nr:unnamed protein product [Fusarium graminearum]CAF3547848.1 unnamed protein product [Fusarium graminearum]CAG1988355.1 unnamed protein product [Fusarium graminearum]CAG2004839.1 unnamed protein product [Fusarium graminearum]
MHAHYLPVRIRALKILVSNGGALKVALGIMISKMIKIEIQHAIQEDPGLPVLWSLVFGTQADKVVELRPWNSP